METVTDQVENILTKIDKLDDRVRNMEKYMWIAFGALGVLQFAAPYISKFLGER
jgi:hypothetical protein